MGGETLHSSRTKVDLIIDRTVEKKRWWQQLLFMQICEVEEFWAQIKVSKKICTALVSENGDCSSFPLSVFSFI